MIDVEKCSLGTFEKDLFVGSSCVCQEVRRLTDKRPQPLDKRPDLGIDLISPKRLLAIENDDPVGFLEVSLDPHAQNVRRECVRDANAAAACLVLIRRPDPA